MKEIIIESKNNNYISMSSKCNCGGGQCSGGQSICANWDINNKRETPIKEIKKVYTL